MKTSSNPRLNLPRNQRAFTLLEVMIATASTLFMSVSFYAAISEGVQIIQVAREDLRATQIMENRMEGIRLFTWNQLTNTTLLPPNFTESFYPPGSTGNGSTQSLMYTGTVSVAAVGLTNPVSSYSNNLYQVTVKLAWRSNGAPHTRQASTYCALYGMQNYVWTSN